MTELLKSSSPEETRLFAGRLAAHAQAGDIIALSGDLGAGKTVFAKGFAEGLGFPYPDEVVSPTFTLMQVYEGGRLPLYHFDVYRMADASEAEAIGIDEYLFGEGVCLIEWAVRIEEILPKERVTRVTIRRDEAGGENDRMMEIHYADAVCSRIGSEDA
ncbi:MAG: tRNA (adenosine(37)-N6)-threonylcarbamoyltransferase complex ATPase subunit type 1 TsaE [Lachnospiraceae bacterium]|nr:tRNA (adenosine(37)-N6)-threonylcarbamoyltransferase complex ATPase subunit type 1 TsaE [Lachnospiraceae bacterium]